MPEATNPHAISADTSVSQDVAEKWTEVRAGFWRRAFALAIDGLIVSIAIQAVVAVLFLATSGRVQIYGDINYTRCTVLPAVPGDLTPPPPARSNFARQCSITFFGAPTARLVQVGEIVPGMKDSDGEPVKSLSKSSMLTSYPVAANGSPAKVIRLDGILIVALVVYLFAMLARTGTTLGGRAMGIRTIDTSAPDRGNLLLRKVALRYAGMMLGWIPAVAMSAIYLGAFASPDKFNEALTGFLRRDTLIEEIGARGLQWESAFSSYLLELPGKILRDGSVALGKYDMLFDGAATIVTLWMAFTVVLIVIRRDTVYDRIAGTRVVLS